MANIVELADFVGSFELQEDQFTADTFDPIRDEYERQFVYKVLGAELGKLFLADFDANTPTTLDPRFQAIYDAFIEDYNFCIVESKGIKEMTKSVVWFFFARDNNITISLGGNKSHKSENSDPSADGLNLAKNYNKAIRTGHAIQWYICQNSSTYPEYNGQALNYIIGI